MYSYSSIVEMGRLDHKIWSEARQRCLDVGGCSECFCVSFEQGRDHWDHCSQSAKSKEKINVGDRGETPI